MNRKGLTLLELVLAIALIAVVSLGGTQLYLSLMRIGTGVQKTTQKQMTLEEVLRDMEMHLRDAKIDSAVNLFPEMSASSSYVGSPMVRPDTTGWTQKRLDFWLSVLNSEGKKVSYMYRYSQDAGQHNISYVARCITEVANSCSDPTRQVILAYGIQPYVDADKNNDGIIDSTEASGRDTNCITPSRWDWTMNPWMACRATVGAWPIFKISSDKKMITISLKAGDVGGKANGVTKAIYLHQTRV